MQAFQHALLQPFRDCSVPAVVAGFISVLIGYTSSFVLIVQAGQAAHLSEAEIVSWVWAVSIAMAAVTIICSLRYRVPVVIAFSTPGAALLIASLPGVSYAEAIGAYIFCSVMTIAVGLSGVFDALMRRVPAALASALLAGILFRIAVQIFVAAEDHTLLVLAMFASFLFARRLVPRYAPLIALAVGIAIAKAMGTLDFSHFRVALAVPVWTTPHFSVSSIVSIGIPLFIVAMASQNMPGLAVLRASGYKVRSTPLIIATGVGSLLFSPFGSHGVSLAAVTAAICTSPDAHVDPTKRYTAALSCSVFYLLAGVFGATIVALFTAFPSALVVSIAALALLGAITGSLSSAMHYARQREAALVTFLVTASGMTLLSIGAAFWGLVAGLLVQTVLYWGKPIEPAADAS